MLSSEANHLRMMRAGSRYELLHVFIGRFWGVPGETLRYFLNCTIANGRLLDERVPSEILSLENIPSIIFSLFEIAFPVTFSP
jgi:hypothetical protein